MKFQGKTYRSLYKWGDPKHEERLDDRTRKLLGQVFGLKSMDFIDPDFVGQDQVIVRKSCSLSEKKIEELQSIVGRNNLSIDDYTRASHSYGKTYLDLIKLRLGIIEAPPDVVIFPRHEQDIIDVISYCRANTIPVIPFGGHSSVTRGLECPQGGITLDMTRHMNSVISINEINQTVRVQAGMMGPDFEKYLNQYTSGYTCGHFPQSFEYSTVGGWVVTRGAGQESSYYGKIEDMVLAIRFITPSGIIETKDYPAAAIGPDINNIILGSEGTFGIVTEVTMRIWHDRQDRNSMSSYLFKSFESAVSVMREVMQAEYGHPALFRLSDPEETDVSFKLKGYDNTIIDRFLHLLRYKAMQRCLLFVTTKGDPEYASFLKKKIYKCARRGGGLPLGHGPVRKWLDQRYSSAYLRDPLMDLGIIVDTLETAVTWDKLIPLWRQIRETVKTRHPSIAMVHISHVYKTGANLYVTFLAKMNKDKIIDDYLDYQKSIIYTIQQAGGSLSHHHGIGRLFAPWIEQELGKTGVELLKAVKNHLDPDNIINPGGILGIS